MNNHEELKALLREIVGNRNLDPRGSVVLPSQKEKAWDLLDAEPAIVPTVQEPIGEVCGTFMGAYSIGNVFFPKDGPLPDRTKLYAAPPTQAIAVEAVRVWIATDEDDEPVMFFTELPGGDLKDRYKLTEYLCTPVAAPSQGEKQNG